VGLFRRRSETLNEQLLKEAGLDPAPAEPESPPPPESSDTAAPFPTGDINLGRHGKVWGGPLEWDTMVTVTAASLAGARIEFTTLPNGDIIIETEQGDADISPLADAVEQHLDPPYRAIASRQDEDLWAVGAKRIQVAKLELAKGDAVELVVNDGAEEVRVDGEPSDAQVPELVQLGEREGSDYCVEATRIDGDFWEVRASAL
jgi:hypothetical protein